jgi:CubicO group peptidase (beta-lactamase class C family)
MTHFNLFASEARRINSQEAITKSFIKAFNNDSRINVIDYLSDNMSNDRIERFGIDAHVGVFLNSQNTFGKLTLVKSLNNEGNNERAVVVSKNNKLTYILNINREKNEPYKINYFNLQDPESIENQVHPISSNELKQELSAFLNNLSDKGAFSGSVLVAKGKDVLLKESVGFANKQWEIKNHIDTRFSLGSMNKMFTAISALQLIEQNKLKFEDKLTQFVDQSWLPEGEVERITVRHLLTHTSGLGNFFNDDFNKSNKEIYRDLSAYKPLVSQAPLLFSPGTRNRYSNSGMLMLGLIIEKVSGKTYYDYVQKNIYDKADMPMSGSFELDSVTTNMASGYLKRMHSDNWVNSIYTRAIKGSPAGGGFSSVGDLHHFALALTSFKLLGKELTEEAYSEKTKYNSAFWYGYGFSIRGESDDRVVGHGGAYLGVDARLDIHLDSNIIVIILANQSDVVSPVRRKVNELIKRLH